MVVGGKRPALFSLHGSSPHQRKRWGAQASKGYVVLEAGHLIDGDSFLVMLASLLRSAHHGTLGPFFENLRQEYQERRKFVNIFQRKLVAPFVRRVCTITWVGGSYTRVPPSKCIEVAEFNFVTTTEI